MGDRCHVEIIVRTYHADAASKAIECLYGQPVVHLDTDDFRYFEFEEVNYANVDEEVNLLTQAGIACDVVWSDGGEYDGGMAWYRFDENGDRLFREVADHEDTIMCSTLMELVDDVPALTALIRKRYEETRPLSWENQDEYGKRHRLKQLITPE